METQRYSADVPFISQLHAIHQEYAPLDNNMLAFPLYLVLTGLTAWGFFNTNLAGWVFFNSGMLFAGWLLLASYSLRSKRIADLAENDLTPSELQVFRRYAFYFMLPFQAKQYSGTFSFIQLLCLIWAALCFWKGEWILMGAMAALFFVATSMAPILNQGNFLRLLHSKGKLPPELVHRLELVEAVEAKILNVRGSRHHV